MTKVLVTDGYLADIADAIRAKNGGSDAYKPGEMAAAIRKIDTSGITPAGTKQITENGTVDVTEFASANVNVPNTYVAADEGKVVRDGSLVEQTRRTVTENGTYDTTGNDEVVVSVPTGGGNSSGSVALNIRSQAFIGSNNTLGWTNTNWPNYKQFWLDLMPFRGKTVTITNTGDRNIYGFTSVTPYDGLALNASRLDSGGSLTLTYSGGSDRYLIYDFSTVVDGGCITVTVS